MPEIIKKHTTHICLLVLFILLTVACKTHLYPAKHWLSPRPLQQGDTILFVAPAGNVDMEKGYLKRADSLVRAWGYFPEYAPHLYHQYYIFAGPDSIRFQDLQQALDNPGVKAIWCARGGYGSVRIIDNLNFNKFHKHPKWLIGFSDITVLHSLFHQKGFLSVHAIMPISLTHPAPERQDAIQSLKDFLKGRKLHYEIPPDSLNIPGKAWGIVTGGNISLLVSLLGSKYQIDPSGKILFLEDTGEYSYSYDRMLYALKNAGYFDNLKGLIVGGTGIKKDDDFIGETIGQIILKHVKNKGYPVIFNFPAGHIVDNRTIIFGKKAKIVVNKDKVVFEQ